MPTNMCQNKQNTRIFGMSNICGLFLIKQNDCFKKQKLTFKNYIKNRLK